VSRLFHAILQRYSPLVESGGLDESYMDVTGCEPLVGTPPEAAELIRERVREELGLPASVGIASSKVVAKVASDAAKPDGVCHVLPGTEAALRGFCKRVGSQLRRSGRRARTVSLKLRYEDFTTMNRSLTPGQPISSDEAIYEAADTLLTRLRNATKRPVRLIGIGVSNFVEDVVQLTLEPSQST